MRPLRSLSESVTQRIPKGPLGFLGEGNAVGAIGFTAVGIVNTFNPVSGLDAGYNIQSHSVEHNEDGEMHTFEINAASKDVARFVARLRSSPSNVDFLLRDTEVMSIEPVVERSTFNTWEVVVEVKDREAVEEAMNSNA